MTQDIEAVLPYIAAHAVPGPCSSSHTHEPHYHNQVDNPGWRKCDGREFCNPEQTAAGLPGLARELRQSAAVMAWWAGEEHRRFADAIDRWVARTDAAQKLANPPRTMTPWFPETAEQTPAETPPEQP